MARSRNIKPGFFANDELAEIEPLGRLLFAGLWTIADREGRLEDRPKKIKAAVLAYDDCDVERLLNLLADRGFITRYEVAGTALIQITTWDRHQNPHKNEPSSVLAPCPNSASTVHAPEQHSSNREDQRPLIPDSSPKTKGEAALASNDDAEPEEAPDGATPLRSAALSLEQQARADNFSQTLTGINGFQPSPQFLVKVVTKYEALDLEECALAIAGHAKKRPKWLNNASILNWLRNDLERLEHPDERRQRSNGRQHDTARSGNGRDPSAARGGRGIFSQFTARQPAVAGSASGSPPNG